jgi:signal transduction histidine kinase
LRLEADLITKWQPNDEWRQKVVSGIRGRHAEFFASASCGVPLRLGDNYRGVLVSGPFADAPDLANMADFIRNIAQTISVCSLGWLQTLNLRARNREAELSTKLLIHRARMSLTQIMGKFGSIKTGSDISESQQVAEDGEKLVANLSHVIGRVLTSRFAEMEFQDFAFQLYPLSAFVQNCVESFRERAKFIGRELVLDPSVECLPNAEIDPTTLSVALGNLIENALKYSFEGTFIRVFSAYDTQQATITIEDLGEEMSEKARDNLIRPGMRWAMSARARRIPGTGLGLWDVSMIAAAHGGTLNFASAYHKQVHGEAGYLVRVWMTLPLKQS